MKNNFTTKAQRSQRPVPVNKFPTFVSLANEAMFMKVDHHEAGAKSALWLKTPMQLCEV
jgi:hypothetical protein